MNKKATIINNVYFDRGLYNKGTKPILYKTQFMIYGSEEME